VARALIVGCGCRGRELGRQLRSRGWQVRGSSRHRAGVEAIEAAGLEASTADPDRPGTILDLCGDVSVIVWLLGSAAGEPEGVEAINGPRLERLLEKLVESPVHGFAYESTGSASLGQLRAGREIVERARETWRIPVAILDWNRDEPGWSERAGEAVAGLLAG
jgi:nucleoside-diphosphate-sugar epimerase